MNLQTTTARNNLKKARKTIRQCHILGSFSTHRRWKPSVSGDLPTGAREIKQKLLGHNRKVGLKNGGNGEDAKVRQG